MSIKSVIPFSAPPKFCFDLISTISTYQHHLNEYTTRKEEGGINSRFLYATIDRKKSPFSGSLRILERFLGIHFTEARIHLYRTNYFMDTHTDTYLPEHDTLILPLIGDNQLEIDGKLLNEKSGQGFMLPEGTPHGIPVVKTVRASLVGWFKPNFD